MQKITLQLCRSSVLRNLWKYWHICNALSFPQNYGDQQKWGSTIFLGQFLTHSHHFHQFSWVFHLELWSHFQLRSRCAVLWAWQATTDRLLPSSSPRRISDVRIYPTARQLASKRSELMSAISWYWWHFSLGLSGKRVYPKTVSYLKIQRSFIIFPTKILIWIHLEYTPISMQTHIYIYITYIYIYNIYIYIYV